MVFPPCYNRQYLSEWRLVVSGGGEKKEFNNTVKIFDDTDLGVKCDNGLNKHSQNSLGSPAKDTRTHILTCPK